MGCKFDTSALKASKVTLKSLHFNSLWNVTATASNIEPKPFSITGLVHYRNLIATILIIILNPFSSIKSPRESFSEFRLLSLGVSDCCVWKSSYAKMLTVLWDTVVVFFWYILTVTDCCFYNLSQQSIDRIPCSTILLFTVSLNVGFGPQWVRPSSYQHSLLVNFIFSPSLRVFCNLCL